MRTFIILLLILVSYLTQAQELNCQVQVVSQQIQGTNKLVFETLQKSLYEFMNNTKWTKHIFSNDERIDCNIMINLTEFDGTSKFAGTIQVQTRRPVYSTNYFSTLLNYKGNAGEFQFEYYEGEALEFNETTHTSNLVSVMSYWAYIAIGLDYDAFSMQGGTQFFTKAQTIVSNAQSAREPGWKPYENDKNKYWIVEYLLDDVYSPIRRCSYRFHRLGLDAMTERIDGGRAEIAESLRLLQKAHRNKPSSPLMNMFLTAKSDEIVKIFSESFASEKAKVFNIMVEIDPANISKYETLKK